MAKKNKQTLRNQADQTIYTNFNGEINAEQHNNLLNDLIESLMNELEPQIGNNLNANNNKITSLSDPTNDQDAATKKYVDDNAGGGTPLSDGIGITANGSSPDLGGGNPVTGQRRVDISPGAGPTNRLDLYAALGEAINKRLQIQQNILSIFATQTDDTFAGMGIEDANAGNFSGSGQIAGFYAKQLGAANNNFGAGIYAERQGMLTIWPGALRSRMLGFRYLADYVDIDWATDLAGDGVYIPHQKRVQEMINASGAPRYGSKINIQLSGGELALGANSNRQIVVQAESGSVDDLDFISDLTAGESIMLYASTGDTITVRHDQTTPKKILLDGGVSTTLSPDNPLHIVMATNDIATQVK